MKNAPFEELSANHGVFIHYDSLPKSKRVIKSDQLSSCKSNQVTNKKGHGSEPVLELKKNGEFVEMINVKCSCGRSTQIVLDYEASEGIDQQPPLGAELD